MTAPSALPGSVYAASLTPLHDDLRVDLDALIAHVRWLLYKGCDGVVLFGTTGEANSFSLAERIAAVEAVLDAGIPPHRLMVGTGCCAVPDTVALTRHAVAHGVGNVLMLPPFYYKSVRDEGLFEAFDQVIQQVGDDALQVYLYHFPQISAIPFSHELVERLLTAYPGTVVGIKDSSGDWMHMKGMMAAFPCLQVYAGTDRFLLDILEAGGAGCISATTNVTSRLAGDIVARYRSEDVRPLQHRLTQIRKAMEAHPVIPTLKWIMAERTGRTAWRNLRPPLTPLGETEVATLLASLQQLNFLDPFSRKDDDTA